LTHAPRKDDAWARAPQAFVWLVWFASAIAAAVYVGRYASRIPFRDDFGLLPYLEGNYGLADFWSQHNEHRIPLPRVLMVALLELRRDLRLLMWAEVGPRRSVAAWASS
jgi:hypothetical protein